MSDADWINTQERSRLSHPEVQHQFNHTHAPFAYVVCSSHAFARGRFVPEFTSPSHLILPYYTAQKSI